MIRVASSSQITRVYKKGPSQGLAQYLTASSFRIRHFSRVVFLLRKVNWPGARLPNMADYDKGMSAKEQTSPPHGSSSDFVDEEVGVVNKSGGSLSRDLKNRHMQMIAIGMLNHPPPPSLLNSLDMVFTVQSTN